MKRSKELVIVPESKDTCPSCEGTIFPFKKNGVRENPNATHLCSCCLEEFEW